WPKSGAWEKACGGHHGAPREEAGLGGGALLDCAGLSAPASDYGKCFFSPPPHQIQTAAAAVHAAASVPERPPSSPTFSFPKGPQPAALTRFLPLASSSCFGRFHIGKESAREMRNQCTWRQGSK
ncbi:unnamed protein product, partial [Urochloa humidicola]